MPVNRHLTPTTYGKGAFELAVMEAGLGGKQILLPAFIPHDFVGVFKRHNITPVFADVEPSTAHLDLESCTPDLLSRSSAIVLLHTFGLPADAERFRDLADAYGLVLVEDCARALGSRRNGVSVGSYGDYAIYSLSKVAPVVRGGILASADPVDSELPQGRLGRHGALNALFLVKFPGLKFIEGPVVGRVRETKVYAVEVGLYKAPKVEALDKYSRFVMRAFMPQYRSSLEKKSAVAAELRRRLEPLGFEFQPDTGDHIYTALGALVPPGVDRNALRAFLKGKAINAFVLWGNPLGTSSLARGLWGTDPEAFPVTSRLASELIHFPISRFISNRDIDRIEGACRQFLGIS